MGGWWGGDDTPLPLLIPQPHVAILHFYLHDANIRSTHQIEPLTLDGFGVRVSRSTPSVTPRHAKMATITWG